jgi:sRNA-binding carbon storage regulator CsrA
MLVLSRRHTETVIMFNAATMELMAVIAVVSEETKRFRLGFHLPVSIGIIRTELTGFKDMPYGTVIRLPFGTKVEILDRAERQESATLPN